MRTHSSTLARALAIALLAAASGLAAPFPPFRIVGSLYYVGDDDLACYLIVTPRGNILINTGMPGSATQIRTSIEALGFKLADTKILTFTHAHIDHVGAMAEMKRLTGAQMWATEADAALLESGGKTDFRFGDDPKMHFAPVRVDKRLAAGAKIALGGTELAVLLHSGHTRGAASFAFDVQDGGRTYHVLIANMGSINPGVVLRKNPKYPEIARDYAATFAAQKALQPDIWLASHAAQFHLQEKHKPGDAYNPNRFVDPAGYRRAVESLEKIYLDQMAREGAGAGSGRATVRKVAPPE